MMSMEREALRGTEPFEENQFENFMRQRQAFADRARTAKVVIEGDKLDWQPNRMGVHRWYLLPWLDDRALTDWYVFLMDIVTHTGKHTHQGGLVIYVIEGEGYTIMDGERVDWEGGDLLLLPVKPAGVEHQHFNSRPDQRCRWIAFVYRPAWDHMAAEITQQDVDPRWSTAS
jgi:mannose-6-phosphate isomerase-like protein (cupin superfamily)